MMMDQDAWRALCLRMSEPDQDALRAACLRMRDALARNEECEAEDVRLVLTLLDRTVEAVLAEIEHGERHADHYGGASTARH